MGVGRLSSYQTILLIVLVIAAGYVIISNPRDTEYMGGTFNITEIPTAVLPDTTFNVKGTFTPSKTGTYLIEVGPIKCPDGCDGNVFNRKATLTASASACDGNLHFSGLFEEMEKDEVYDFSFNVKSSDIIGEYTYQVYAYDKCSKDGGKELAASEQRIINVRDSVPESDVDEYGHQAGLINDVSFDGFTKTWSSITAWWNDCDEYVKFIVGALGIMIIVVLFGFQTPKKES